MPEEVKPVAAPAGKKKKRANRPLKITNTHMKQQVRSSTDVANGRVSTFQRIMSLGHDGPVCLMYRIAVHVYVAPHSDA